MPRPRLPLLHHEIYRTDPDADWIVLVHGAGVTSEIWSQQIEAYRGEFNLLLPDLRGHGGSATAGADDDREGHHRDHADHADHPDHREPHTFEAVSRDVLDLLDHHGIEAAHFVGVSMGCLVVRTVAELAPERVRSMVLAGAIGRLKRRARVLIALAHALKHVVPHMWLYRFYAWVLLPRKDHLASRRTVVRQARRLTRAEFLRWLPVSRELPPLLRRFESQDPGIPTLYVMGDEDHMFLPGARAVAAEHREAVFHVLERCGHVCTVQQPDAFNRVSLEFLRGGARESGG